MILLPTLYRPENLRRFVQAYKATDAMFPVWVLLDKDNAFHYQSVELPFHFKRCFLPAGTKIGDAFNMVFRDYPNEVFYAILADDVVPESKGWDQQLCYHCVPDKITWGFDGGHDETLPRHPFIGGKLARRLGYLSVPGVKHWYVDNGWRDIAQALDCGVYLPDIKMNHFHPTNGKAQKDRTYLEQPDPRADEITYNLWREQELPKLAGPSPATVI